ncbi:hypothetical protein PYV61_04260, partial [Roseisolibacter sp. H3M3-2]
MSEYTRRRVPLVLALAAVASAAACGGSEKTDAALQDSALARDLALANQDSAAQPALTDVPDADPAPAPGAAAAAW